MPLPLCVCVPSTTRYTQRHQRYIYKRTQGLTQMASSPFPPADWRVHTHTIDKVCAHQCSCRHAPIERECVCVGTQASRARTACVCTGKPPPPPRARVSLVHRTTTNLGECACLRVCERGRWHAQRDRAYREGGARRGEISVSGGRRAQLVRVCVFLKMFACFSTLYQDGRARMVQVGVGVERWKLWEMRLNKRVWDS